MSRYLSPIIVSSAQFWQRFCVRCIYRICIRIYAKFNKDKWAHLGTFENDFYHRIRRNLYYWLYVLLYFCKKTTTTTNKRAFACKSKEFIVSYVWNDPLNRLRIHVSLFSYHVKYTMIPSDLKEWYCNDTKPFHIKSEVIVYCVCVCVRLIFFLYFVFCIILVDKYTFFFI